MGKVVNKTSGDMHAHLERYRLYIDESGDHVFHDEARLAEPGHRYLALVGCWFAQGDAYLRFQRALEDLKQKHFPHSPDEPLILHRKDLVNCSGPFWRLRDDAARQAFDSDLCALLASTDFALLGVCIDKLRLKEQYPAPFHPYHVALGFILQRYCGWLNHVNRQGDVMAESRGKTEDLLLRNAYQHIWVHGDRFHDADFYQRPLTSGEAKLSKKSANIAGLQLADLLAHAVRDDIIGDHRSDVTVAPFDSRLLTIASAKYNRHLYDGRIEGYGKVLFPK